MLPLFSLINKLKVATFGESLENNESEIDTSLPDEDEDESAVVIPQIKIGLHNTKHRSAEEVRVDTKEEDDQIERVESIGVITALDNSMHLGVIERQYRFNISKFCTTNDNPFARGVKVEFQAERSRLDPQWKVTSMKIYESSIEKVNKERCQYRKVIAKVKFVDKEKVQVEAGKDKSAQRIITIPNKKEFYPGFVWMQGDWMQVHLKKLDSEEGGNDDDLPVDLTSSVVLSVAPLQKRTLVGKVTKRHHNFLIDNSIYFTQDICPYPFPLGTVVKCTAIQSTQHIGDGELQFVNWRATKIEKSNFLHYTSPDANLDGAGEWIDDTGREAIVRYQDLMMDKCGIRITPRSVRFPALQIGTSALKSISICNTTSEIHKLKEVKFNQDPSVCLFEIRCIGQQEGDENIKEIIVLPNDELQFQITCKPMMVGKTTEMCVFDFDDFVIAREVSVVGQSEEEKNLTIDTIQERPHFKKQIGEEDISRIITDRNRRRIRGSQTVRAPFFSQKRLPLNKVPSELYKILKDQDETELLRLHPNALEGLTFDNYKQKFMVSLWFEEIENDLRRRQYDIHNVRLTRHGGNHSAVYFTFQVAGIQDFQPPVNLQDTIDAFDEEHDSNAKFQGTITKICESEVTCTFGDAFNEQYSGSPLTVQFNLGRTNYKRCHFAIQTAVDYLGEAFLFPDQDIVVKPARILTYEDDKDKPTPDDKVEEEQTIVKKVDKRNKSTIFSKSKPLPMFNGAGASSPTNADNVIVGRRAQSLRSRFVSDTANSPSCKDAKLEWFNPQLNHEQKDAVRRILRGLARPLPYIIYGPPGTGKTVTLVEAVMQVNKLDENSRVLVCAPSNAAADVIAEYLANSNQYDPGEFIRLNGFMRAGQNLLETIAPFCVDGEDLGNVAMHRLIVATCMTAGQFFSLDLSIGHFTHVFIDEAGYCTEPEAMVPTILLALSKGGQLILAGDPNQLGPVLMSDVSQNCGLNRSLLERLMHRKLYCRNPDQFPVTKYNPLVLTKLVRNYRAHATLLTLPSSLFYDNDLLSEAPYEEAYALCQNPGVKSILVNEGVPLIFHGVQGSCTRERDSPSWCNKAEAVQVAQYVAALIGKCGLKSDDIGIITPYRKQVEKIRLALQFNLMGQIDELPKVASVEEFQGGERKVIIISTVRSGQQDKIDSGFLERLGFLYQPKRFNVVITRAKALMIVIGNPHVLCRNTFWMHLLSYALELNAYKGCNLPIHLDQQLRHPKSEWKMVSVEATLEKGSNVGQVDAEGVGTNGVDKHEFDDHF